MTNTITIQIFNFKDGSNITSYSVDSFPPYAVGQTLYLEITNTTPEHGSPTLCETPMDMTAFKIHKISHGTRIRYSNKPGQLLPTINNYHLVELFVTEIL